MMSVPGNAGVLAVGPVDGGALHVWEPPARITPEVPSLTATRTTTVAPATAATATTTSAIVRRLRVGLPARTGPSADTCVALSAADDGYCNRRTKAMRDSPPMRIAPSVARVTGQPFTRRTRAT